MSFTGTPITDGVVEALQANLSRVIKERNALAADIDTKRHEFEQCEMDHRMGEWGAHCGAEVDPSCKRLCLERPDSDVHRTSAVVLAEYREQE